MKDVFLNSIDVILALVICFFIFIFWNKNLRKKYLIEEVNRSYAFFLSFQVLALFFIIIEGNDPQNQMYMAGLKSNVSNSIDIWSLYGVKIISYVFLLIISNLIGMIFYKFSLFSKVSLLKEVENDNWYKIVFYGIFLTVISYLLSLFILRPFLFDWISSNATLVPIN